MPATLYLVDSNILRRGVKPDRDDYLVVVSAVNAIRAEVRGERNAASCDFHNNQNE